MLEEKTPGVPVQPQRRRPLVPASPRRQDIELQVRPNRLNEKKIINKYRKAHIAGLGQFAPAQDPVQNRVPANMHQYAIQTKMAFPNPPNYQAARKNMSPKQEAVCVQGKVPRMLPALLRRTTVDMMKERKLEKALENAKKPKNLKLPGSSSEESLMGENKKTNVIEVTAQSVECLIFFFLIFLGQCLASRQRNRKENRRYRHESHETQRSSFRKHRKRNHRNATNHETSKEQLCTVRTICQK